VRRIVRVHSRPDDVVLDFFAGSGTTGEAAAIEGRRFVLVDDARDAAHTCKTRLAAQRPRCIGFR
jgi:site-specific DNA-methyltransferase (adenine-specific)